MKVIEGGVTAAKGYKAAGLRAGIKAGKTNKDMASRMCRNIYKECCKSSTGFLG